MSEIPFVRMRRASIAALPLGEDPSTPPEGRSAVYSDGGSIWKIRGKASGTFVLCHKAKDGKVSWYEIRPTN